MSNTKMLIDATHSEETRVVVQRNGRVEEFDFESAARKLLRGNIYLAKVTRVEPSLQAAFVDYGGNRHGFLAFNEIHPDYYQIPVADRLALIEEEAAAEAELEAAADRRAEALARRSSQRAPQHAKHQSGDDADAEPADDEHSEAGIEAESLEAQVSHIVDVEEDEHIEEIGGEEGPTATKVIAASATVSVDDVIVEPAAEASSDEDDDDDEEGDEADAEVEHEHDHEHDHDHHDHAHHHDDHAHADEAEEYAAPAEGDEAATVVASTDEHDAHPAEAHDAITAKGHEGDEGTYEPSNSYLREESAARHRRRPRSYKIQEVIKRRQIILVQVVKEERGNKGAALTTYLSLAGRYTVLMPNTARGGGISRKITNPQDRKRLKAIAQELEVPEGMGLIIRTAGAARTKQEIKRDFEYLLRLWESVRELTLQSTAPSLVYEEGDLIKRSIRDLYNKDVEEIVVAGNAGHQEAAEFMKMLMPSHAKNVVPYKDPTPLFTRYGVERQLNAMFQPQVTLRSGGYIVINQTEALVAIDVNSGKSTREFSIEETALATNLEAADEIARQLKLRDLAGLIVIDFIDMEEKRNNRAVERRLKDALRFDRARIQLGRISHFGLMEMSRQRLRTGVLEGSTSQCAHCQGTGIIRSTESIALAVLRGLEDAITAGANSTLIATTTTAVALYILNSKRAYLSDMEARHGYAISIVGSERIHGANFTVERGAATISAARRPERAAVNMDWGFDGEEAPEAFEGGATIEVIEDDAGEDDNGSDGERRPSFRGESSEDGSGRRGRRRRRRGRGGRDRGEGRERFSNDRDETAVVHAGEGPQPDIDDGEDQSAADEEAQTGAQTEEAGDERGEETRGGARNGRRRRRGRRGGRRGRDRREGGEANGSEGVAEFDAEDGEADPSDEASARDDMRDDVRPEASEGDGAEAASQPVEPARPAPKPRRVWDRPATAASANDDEIAPRPAVIEEAPVIAELPLPPPEAVAPVRRRHEVGSTEPRIERVVVTPGQDESGSGELQATPQRKGWWQRKFSGE